MRKDVRSHSVGRPAASEKPIPAERFKAEVRAWAGRLDVQPADIHIARMKRKWASCSTRGRLTFNVELLELHEEFRREVIVHELLHLKVPNHGPLFQALLKAYLSPAPSGNGIGQK